MPAERSLYLFDGYNLLHAAGFARRQELVDRLAGYVAFKGVRGIVVFDGVGDEAAYGALEVRFAPSADQLIERLAAESRESERVCVVSSDRAIHGTAGRDVTRLSSQQFLEVLASGADATRARGKAGPSRIEDALDDETRSRLERWRRRRT